MSWGRICSRTSHNYSSKKAGMARDQSTTGLLAGAMRHSPSILALFYNHRTDHLFHCSESLAPSRVPGSSSDRQSGLAFQSLGPSGQRFLPLPSCKSPARSSLLCWSLHRSEETWLRPSGSYHRCRLGRQGEILAPSPPH